MTHWFHQCLDRVDDRSKRHTKSLMKELELEGGGVIRDVEVITS